MTIDLDVFRMDIVINSPSWKRVPCEEEVVQFSRVFDRSENGSGPPLLIVRQDNSWGVTIFSCNVYLTILINLFISTQYFISLVLKKDTHHNWLLIIVVGKVVLGGDAELCCQLEALLVGLDGGGGGCLRCRSWQPCKQHRQDGRRRRRYGGAPRWGDDALAVLTVCSLIHCVKF